MTRTTNTSRKIKKRKRNEDTDLCVDAPTGATPGSSSNNTAPVLTSLPLGTSKTEKNKKKKAKKRLKKKQRKANNSSRSSQAPRPGPSFIPSTRRWKWKTLKSASFTLKQKKLLFQVHHLSTILERNKSTIYNLQSNLSTTSFKTNTGNLTFTTESCTQQTPPLILQAIKYLEDENKTLTNKILQLQEKEKSEHLKRVQHLKRLNRNHGYFLRKRIYSLTTNLNNFLNHIQSRIYLWEQNTALLLEIQHNLVRKSLLLAEKENLASTNKIHNFTDISLPPDLTELLNKGTNFIPTTDNINIPTLRKTISSEVNSALSKVICKGTSHQAANQPVRKKSSNFNNRYHPYTKKNPVKLLQEKQTKPHFNLHIIDYVHNTTSYSKQYLQSSNFKNLINPQHLNITQSLTSHIRNLNTRNDIILTKTDKNMGWALVPTTWFTNEYTRQLSDSSTYKRINNFDQTKTITDSNKLLRKLQIHFNKLLTTSTDKQLLNTVTQDKLQLPYMKLLPKVHKLTDAASPSNLNKLTGRPIITAHSWTTSNPSRLLGTELDKIILRLKDIFEERNIPYPLIYNSTDLLDLLHDFYVDDIDKFTLTTFDFTSLYTNISFSDTIHAIITSCKLLALPTFYRDFLLNLNNFVNDRNFFLSGQDIYQQTKGVAMGSYHSRQIADLVLLLSELTFFSNNDTTGLFIFCRYIDDGFMLTDRNSITNHITHLSSTYPSQIPITFTTNCHSTHYLDLTISLNYHTILYHKIHHHIYQKPHHKYMYPHFSSNHPQHIFTGIIKTETIRYSRLSKTKDDYSFIHKLFTLRLTALDYPSKLITDNSYPWLPYYNHKRRRLNKTHRSNNKPTVYYHSKYNKHARTDKVVRHILHKYHNIHIPKLTKAYCNTTKLHTMLLTNKLLHSKIINS